MNIENKLCVITGANSGIGFETAKELASQGAYIVMVCRNEDKAISARKSILDETSAAAGIDIVICDFSIQSDIHSAAKEINEKYEKIDVLINNHGFIAAEYKETIDGIEETFAVNHLGYFIFTKLLLNKIENNEGARIINVASEAHRTGSFNADDIEMKKGYSAWKAYGNSKLFNILFTKELADRLKSQNVTVNCLHPGVIASNFASSGNLLTRLFWKVASPFMLSSEGGAQTTIFLATSDDVEGVSGAYFKNKKAVSPTATARNSDFAKKLCEISEKYVS